MPRTNSICECLNSCLAPLFCPLNSEEVIRKHHSKAIDKELSKEKKRVSGIHKLLLLGAGESGKSTIIQQMQLIHFNEFSDAMRRKSRETIRSNLAEAIVSILGAMPVITPPLTLDNAEHESMAKWILEHATKDNFEYPFKFYEYTKVLWKDAGVQAAFERSNEYQLIDNAKYFFGRIDFISKEDYLPTDQDILRSRAITTAIYELMFTFKHVKFHLIDVGGQRDQRRKWFLCFNDVTAIIFVASCSSYNLVLREDSTKNRLRESLELFAVVWNNRWLSKISVIGFLNKQDLFREKILSGRSKLEDYFPEYRNFKTAVVDRNEHPEVNRAKHFLKHQFEEISRLSKNDFHRFYPHFTCAVDTKNIKIVFEDCQKDIQIQNMNDHGLL